MAWLRERGFGSKEKDWSVVGAQELTIHSISNGSREADLLFETYAGVTLFTVKSNEEYFKELKVNHTKDSTSSKSPQQ